MLAGSCVNDPGPDPAIDHAGVYLDDTLSRSWMATNAVSLAVDMVVQQPAAIIGSTIATAAFGPIISRAVAERAATVIPGV